jgi:hypothetical protein
VRLLIAGACALLGGCASLTPETRAEEALYQAELYVDGADTLDIARHPHTFHELNPALGHHPSQAKVAAVIATTSAAHAFVTVELSDHGAPAWVLRTWEVCSISVEAGAVAWNAHVGLHAW